MLFGGEHGGVLWSDVGGCSYSLVAFWFFAGKWSQMAITPTCIGQPESPSPATSVTGTYPPCGRVGAGLGWSPPNNRFVLFGGQGFAVQSQGPPPACSGYQYEFLNDTWSYQNPVGGAYYWQNASDPGYVGDPPYRAVMGYAAAFTDKYF